MDYDKALSRGSWRENQDFTAMENWYFFSTYSLFLPQYKRIITFFFRFPAIISFKVIDVNSIKHHYLFYFRIIKKYPVFVSSMLCCKDFKLIAVLILGEFNVSSYLSHHRLLKFNQMGCRLHLWTVWIFSRKGKSNVMLLSWV